MRTAHVKPAEGIRVRDPLSGKHIPEHGCTVPLTSYWVRKLKHGEVVEVEVTKASSPKRRGRSERKDQE